MPTTPCGVKKTRADGFSTNGGTDQPTRLICLFGRALFDGTTQALRQGPVLLRPPPEGLGLGRPSAVLGSREAQPIIGLCAGHANPPGSMAPIVISRLLAGRQGEENSG